LVRRTLITLLAVLAIAPVALGAGTLAGPSSVSVRQTFTVTTSIAATISYGFPYLGNDLDCAAVASGERNVHSIACPAGGSFEVYAADVDSDAIRISSDDGSELVVAIVRPSPPPPTPTPTPVPAPTVVETGQGTANHDYTVSSGTLHVRINVPRPVTITMSDGCAPFYIKQKGGMKGPLAGADCVGYPSYTISGSSAFTDTATATP
jgi:hypothetical protein